MQYWKSQFLNSNIQFRRYANSQTHSPRFTDLQIPLPRIMYLRIPSHRFTNSRTSQKSWLSHNHDVANSSCTIHLAQAKNHPKIFAPPFEMNESGSISDSIKPSSINLYIHLYTILQQSLQKDKVWRRNCSRIRRYSPNIDSFGDRRIISFQSSQKYIWRISSQSMKIHLPVQHPKYADRLTPWLRTEARGLKSIHYTPTQAGKQSRTDCFTQTCRYDSWLRIAVPPIAVADNPQTAESTSYLEAWQSQALYL